MKVSLTLTTSLTFLLANGAISRLHEVGSNLFKQRWAYDTQTWPFDYLYYNIFISKACRPPMPIQTPNLRAANCDATREVTGYRVLTGCTKDKTFTRTSGPCTGYSKSYALDGYKSAEECANYCMVDAKGLATLIGFNFDCNVCEWWVDTLFS